MTTVFNLSQDSLLCANIQNSLLRGSGEIIEDSPEGIFVYESLGQVYYLMAPPALGKEWLCKHEERGYNLIVLYNDALISFAAERYHLSLDETCKQIVWTEQQAPARTQELFIRHAQMADLELCMSVYHQSSPEDIRGAVELGNVFLAYKEDEFVGMIGLHMDGSMGMLDVLPAYRRRGYGTEMERMLIAHQLAQGCIPYGQVHLSNNASFALQENIGMKCSQGTLTWLYRE